MSVCHTSNVCHISWFRSSIEFCMVVYLKTLSLTNKTNQLYVWYTKIVVMWIGIGSSIESTLRPVVTKKWWWYLIASTMSYHSTIEGKHKKHYIRILLILLVPYLVDIALWVQFISDVRTTIVHCIASYQGYCWHCRLDWTWLWNSLPLSWKVHEWSFGIRSVKRWPRPSCKMVTLVLEEHEGGWFGQSSILGEPSFCMYHDSFLMGRLSFYSETRHGHRT